MSKRTEIPAGKPTKKTAVKLDLTAPSALIDARWFPIDNASNLYAFSYRKKWNRTFRVAVVLDEDVDPQILQTALDDTATRYPALCAFLRSGFFWGYFERTDEMPIAKEEDNLPYRAIPLTGTRQPNFRIQYYKKRISLEMFHSLTDAPCSFAFLSSLVTRYYELKGMEIDDFKQVRSCADTPTNLETIDPYIETAIPVKTRNPGKLETYFIKQPVQKRYVRVTHGIMRVPDIKAVSKPLGVTITEYFSAVIIQSYIRLAKKPIQKPIRISIPVNLRTRLNIDSIRNFVYMFDISFDPQGRTEVSVEEICTAIAGQIRSKTTPDSILQEISANVSAQQNPLSRIVPAVIKRQVLKSNYRKSQCSYTTFLSNYGILELPDAVAAHVVRAEFVLGDTPYQPLGFACATIGDTLTLSVNAATPDMDLQRTVFSTLAKAGIPVYIESNFHE